MDASPQYTIDVIDDQPPAVRFSKPGRDTQASPVEELFLEARADDDFGVQEHAAVLLGRTAAPPKTVPLLRRPKPLTGSRAPSHTIYLEELGLKPGDFVSYYAKATDTDGVQGAEDRDERHLLRADPAVPEGLQAGAVAGDGGGGGGGGGQQVGQLSRQQREIVAGDVQRRCATRRS